MIDLGTHDVAVIGAGPAGSATATWLARRGHDVCVLESAEFPRHHLGESLLGITVPYLDDLGALDRMTDGSALEKHGAVFAWGGARDPVVLDMVRPSFQVKRADFDQDLVDLAGREGAQLWFGHSVRSIDLTDPLTQLQGRGPAGPFSLRARFVVDATGGRQLLARHQGLGLGQVGPRRLSLYGYFAGARRPSHGHPNDLVTEATPDGWLWFIPLDDDLTSVGLVTDAERRPSSVADAFSAQIRASSEVRRLLAPARQIGVTRAFRYTNHLVADPLWRSHAVLVGDAAAFVDPLFSTGVHSALHDAALASAGISAVLEGADETAVADWYDRRVRHHHDGSAATVELLYRLHPGAGPFWQRRHDPVFDEAEAEMLVQRLGPTGAPFFHEAIEREYLAIPEPLARRFGDFRPAPRQPGLSGDTVVELAPEVTRHRDLMRFEGAATRAVSISHARRRLVHLEWPEDHPQARIIDALRGRRTVSQIADAARLSRDERDAVAGFLGALTARGHVRTIAPTFSRRAG